MRRKSEWRHGKLPDHSALLAGHTPPDEIGFASDRIQTWYNKTTSGWSDPAPHYHEESDEIFIVLQGSLLLEVEGARLVLGAREFCCFPAGTTHAVIDVTPPVETLMIRAPSVNDKAFPPSE